ncbi:MAG: hypothetical protein MRY49_03170, partial [Candidatus Pacebacteria bacterium]|nr:hypothetical protein [Candidatus Paceibacterota bacterium]
MNLLIVTQKVSVNDPILGFFHRWIIEFSKHFESIIIFCLEEGEHNLPSNVKVYSLGKDRGFGKFSVLKTFISLVWNKRKEYDRVLVHMNPIYLVIAGFVWRFVFRKKVFLWYTHKSVDLKLRIAEKFPSKIFTASKESFRLPSRKVIVTRHGIDTNIFKPDYIKKDGRGLRMLTVGRISRSKSYFVFIRALSMLVNKGLDA